MTVEERLEKIEAALAALVELIEQKQARQWYSISEFSRIVGRSELTCREWCRKARISATKKTSGRGAHLAWAISHEALLDYQRDGLSPCRLPAADGETKGG